MQKRTLFILVPLAAFAIGIADVSAADPPNIVLIISDDQDDAREAVASFRRAIDYNPEHVEATLELGFGLAMMQQYEEAIEKFHRTLELAPGHVKAEEYLADAEAAQRRPSGNR